jgi:hypothetical protein
VAKRLGWGGIVFLHLFEVHQDPVGGATLAVFWAQLRDVDDTVQGSVCEGDPDDLGVHARVSSPGTEPSEEVMVTSVGWSSI